LDFYAMKKYRKAFQLPVKSNITKLQLKQAIQLHASSLQVIMREDRSLSGPRTKKKEVSEPMTKKKAPPVLMADDVVARFIGHCKKEQ
jgi:Sin3 binding region of histone deacetylase complex subunit SAP30